MRYCGHRKQLRGGAFGENDWLRYGSRGAANEGVEPRINANRREFVFVRGAAPWLASIVPKNLPFDYYLYAE